MGVAESSYGVITCRILRIFPMLSVTPLTFHNSLPSQQYLAAQCPCWGLLGFVFQRLYCMRQMQLHASLKKRERE